MVRFVNVALISTVVPAAALQESTSGHDVTLRRRELGAADLDVDVSPKQVGKIALGAAAGAGIFKAGEFLRDALTVDSESAESVDTTTTKAPSPSPTAPPAYTTTTKAPSPSPTAPPALSYDLVADKFVGYPTLGANYTNMPTWTVSMDFDSEDATVGTYEWNLGDSSCVRNDTTANSCGVHVHFGSSCKYAWLIGGHSFNTTVDPWATVSYDQSTGNETVDSGVKATDQKTDSLVDALIVHVVDLKAGLNQTQIDQKAAAVHQALTDACDAVPQNFTQLNDCLLGENSTVAQASALPQLSNLGLIIPFFGANPRQVAFYVNVVLAVWELGEFTGNAFKEFWEGEPVWKSSGVFVVHDKDGDKTHCSNIVEVSTAAPSAAPVPAPSAAPVPASVY